LSDPAFAYRNVWTHTLVIKIVFAINFNNELALKAVYNPRKGIARGFTGIIPAFKRCNKNRVS
jgi:hypothetical protein